MCRIWSCHGAVQEGGGHQRRGEGHAEADLVGEGHEQEVREGHTTRSGKLTITTTGKARKLFVKLRLTAPATPAYTAYSYTKTWKITK